MDPWTTHSYPTKTLRNHGRTESRLDHATFFWNKTTMATSGPRHSADTHGDQRL